MKTDSLFYRLFQERPASVFEPAGLTVPDASAYRLHAEEIKQTAFRLDGVLRPAVGRADLPLVFTEAQFYDDPWFYARWLASIFLYLYRHRIVGHWQAAVVDPSTPARRPPTRSCCAAARCIASGSPTCLRHLP